MGQTLSSPATDKETEYGVNEKFLYALTGMQGWRISMEDSHSAILKLDESKSDLESNAFFGVFDGHGGANVAKYAGQYLWKRIISDERYKKGDYAAALKSAFLGCDADMKSHPDFARDSSGCTAVTTLITHDNRLFCANAGDSRAIICTKGVAKDLSIDHKPKLESERKRIISAGGFVEYGRVNGNLALSRAFGDFEYKKNKSLPAEDQIITCDPEIVEHQITEEDEFVVIACDGIWDCLNSQQVADFVRAQVAQGKDLAKIAEDMCNHCLAPSVGGGEGIGADNMTVLIVALLHGKSPKDWVSWIKDRVDRGYGYKTPSEPARIWPESQVQEGKRKRELYAARESTYRSQNPDREGSRQDETFRRLYGISAPTWDLGAHILGSNGGITYKPGSSAIADLHNLMFDSGDDDDFEGPSGGGGGHIVQLVDEDQMEVSSEDSDELMKDGEFEDAKEGEWRHGEGEGEGYPSSGFNATKGLREQLEELEKEDQQAAAAAEKEGPSIQGEAPPPPKAPAPVIDGDAPNQLVQTPGGDAPSDAVKHEGLLDASESPLKT